MPSTNVTDSDSFTPSLLIWMPVISFPYVTVVSRTFSTLLNKSDENGHLCVIPDLKEKAFSFSLLSIYYLWGCHAGLLLG